MIVNEIKGNWEIIFQRNHALLAGKIAMALKAELRPPYWPETLVAIMDHDDGQNDFGSGEHLTAEGYPKDFRAYDFHLKQAERVVNIASHKGRWVFLMVSLHAYALRKDVEDKSTELKKFLRKQKINHAALCKYFNISMKKAWNYYKFLRWCDELSLILCEHRVGKMNSEAIIGDLADVKECTIEYLHNATLTVRPWCFKSTTLVLTAECHLLKRRRFKNPKALKKALEKNDPAVKTWNFYSPEWLIVS